MRVLIIHTLILMVVGLARPAESRAQNSGSVGIEKDRYGFNLKHFRTSFRHEFGVSFFSHFYRSPSSAIHYEVMDGTAYPQPVFNRGFGLFSLHYEPRFRLLEYRDWASVTLDIPLAVGFTLVELATEDGFKYSSDTVSDASFNAGIFSAQRENDIGLMHAEAGALLSLNLWQGATYENTSALGVSIGVGANRMLSPLIMNFISGYEREEYQQYTAWWTPVSRLSLHFRGVLISYTIGINPTVVYYESLNSKRAVYTNTYNRFSIALRIGR